MNLLSSTLELEKNVFFFFFKKENSLESTKLKVLFCTITKVSPKAKSIETNESSIKIMSSTSVLFDIIAKILVFIKNKNQISSLTKSTDIVE